MNPVDSFAPHHHSETNHSIEKTPLIFFPAKKISPQRNRKKISARELFHKFFSPTNPVKKNPPAIFPARPHLL